MKQHLSAILRSAVLALVALFATMGGLAAIDLTTDLGGFAPLQAQGLRDSYVAKRGGLCTTVYLPSITDEITGVGLSPYDGTVRNVYALVHKSPTNAKTLTIFNNTLTSSMGTITIPASAVVGTIEFLTPSSNNTTSAGGLLAAYVSETNNEVEATTVDTAIPMTVMFCIEPSAAFVQRNN